MASDVGIANAALLKIGEKAITSFTDPGDAALMANNTYAYHRDALLRAHEWSFAVRRTSLAATGTAPSWEFDYAYNLPAAPHYCLRVLTVYNPNNMDWRVEGRQILTDLGAPLYIKYIWQVTDPNQWDALFHEIFIAKLAWEWAEALTKDRELCDRLLKEFIGKKMEAEAVDGQEGKTEPMVYGTWVETHQAS
jgi:hypothetical protein